MRQWMIIVTDSEQGEAEIFSFVKGRKDKVRKYMTDLVKKYKAEDEKSFESGCLTKSDVQGIFGGRLYAFAAFEKYRMDITAIPEYLWPDIQEL